MLPPIIMRTIAGILLSLLASVNSQGNVLHGQGNVLHGQGNILHGQHKYE